MELIAGKGGHVNYNTVPGIVYTHPEVASVGLTEEGAKEKGLKFKVRLPCIQFVLEHRLPLQLEFCQPCTASLTRLAKHARALQTIESVFVSHLLRYKVFVIKSHGAHAALLAVWGLETVYPSNQ